MNKDEPTMSEIVPPGTTLGWSDTLYALLGLVGEVVWVSSTPTEEVGKGPDIVFSARLLRVLTVDRREEEWAALLKFEDGASVMIPKPGFRGSLLAGDLTVVTDDATILIGPPSIEG